MAVDVMLHEAIDAIRRGQRARARDLLTRLLRADQKNPTYWLWMSSVVESPNEQIYCLKSVLRADPQNPSARQGLILLGALPAGEAVKPVPPIHRPWTVDLLEIQEVGRIRALLGNMVVRIVMISVVTLALIGIAGIIFYNWMQPEPVAQQLGAIRPTRTPQPEVTLTATRTPINYTPTPPTATPTFEGGVPPLWLKLKATFTPTPMYVATMHIANEAYNTGMTRFERGDLEGALERLEQATRFEPYAPDIQYYIGEIYMALKDYQQAYGAFQRAIDIDQEFAPAYLGRARARLAVGPNPNVITDLDTALELDDKLTDAYLLRIEYHLANGDEASALEDLLHFEKLHPNSAKATLYRAQLLLAEGEVEGALEAAQKANKLDPTLLDAYLMIGQTAALSENYDEALEALEVYLLYEPENPQALVSYGKALFADKQFDETMKVMENALELDDELPEAYYYRGLVLIEDDQGQKAVNELLLARNLDRASFDYSLALGRALLSANRLAEARDQITAASRLAKSDEELAQVHYYRALAIEAIGNQPSADKDWEALLELPEEAVPNTWLRIARRRLATPTPTRTPTPTGSRTPQATDD